MIFIDRIYFLILNRIYSDRSELDSKFQFQWKVMMKTLKSALFQNYQRYRFQIEYLNKDCVKISRLNLLYFPRNKPSKSVTVGSGPAGKKNYRNRRKIYIFLWKKLIEHHARHQKISYMYMKNITIHIETRKHMKTTNEDNKYH